MQNIQYLHKIEFTQIRWFSEQSGVRLDLVRGCQRHSILS
jgi:hypothetical protein